VPFTARKAQKREGTGLNKREINECARIRRENARLRRENEYLKHRIERLSPKEAKNVPPERELFYRADDIDEHKGYFAYLVSRFRLSLIYRVYDKIFFTLRKVILASRIWKYTPVVLGIIFALFQGLLTLGSAVVLLPTVAAGAVAFSALSAFPHHRSKLLDQVRGRKIYFMYPAQDPRKNGAFYETMHLLSRDGVVFAVTPSLRLCGFGAVRKSSENVYFIHTSFYYRFKEKATALCSDVVKVY
jgi:hypothetical protein